MKEEIEFLKKSQKEEVFERLFQDSQPSFNFFLLLSLSTVIITLGLLINNPSIIIGGMLIAPMLWPILSLGMGVVVSDLKLIKNSAWVIFKASLLILVIATLISIMFLEARLNPEIVSRTDYALVYFFVAFISGIGASYAFSRSQPFTILAGVAISVALIPPLCVAGIGLSMLNREILMRGLGVFFLTFLGILFGSLIVFSILDFHEIKRKIKKTLEKAEKENNKNKRKKVV